MSQRYSSIPHAALALAAIAAVTVLALMGKVPGATAVVVIIAAAGIGSSASTASKAVDVTAEQNGNGGTVPHVPVESKPGD